MKTNQLHINRSKCAHMYFRPSLSSEQRMTCAKSTPYNERRTIAVNSQKIKQVDKVKFLGVIIDENLTWDDQIKHLENKLLHIGYYSIHKTHQEVYTLFPILQNLSITICFTTYLCNFLLGRNISF